MASVKLGVNFGRLSAGTDEPILLYSHVEHVEETKRAFVMQTATKTFILVNVSE